MSSSLKGTGAPGARAAFPPLALYAHLPWCVQKCPYCDFNSHRAPAALPEVEYVAALLADLDAELPRGGGRALASVYIGGGTPSLFSARAIAMLLDGIRARTPLAPGAEITLEANPGTVEAANFRGYRDAGVNRLSLGIQSFDDASLRALGRIHDAAQAHRAIDTARAAGFDNLNLDLMFGLPDQSVESAQADLAAALAHDTGHLSLYELTLEPGTPFGRTPPPLPPEPHLAEMQASLHARLRAAGFAPYEISAHARDGRIGRHNLNYWRFGDYIGIGAGAHGKLTGERGVERTARVRNPLAYMGAAGTSACIAGRHVVPAQDLPLEFMMNALRLYDGVETGLYEERTGQPLTTLAPALAAGEAKGLLDLTGGRMRATNLGRRFLNDVLALFMPRAVRDASAGTIG